MVISNHNSFRVLFDKIASVYFIWKICLYFSQIDWIKTWRLRQAFIVFIIYTIRFSTGNGQLGKPALCRLYRHAFVSAHFRSLSAELHSPRTRTRKIRRRTTPRSRPIRWAADAIATRQNLEQPLVLYTAQTQWSCTDATKPIKIVKSRRKDRTKRPK